MTRREKIFPSDSSPYFPDMNHFHVLGVFSKHVCRKTALLKALKRKSESSPVCRFGRHSRGKWIADAVVAHGLPTALVLPPSIRALLTHGWPTVAKGTRFIRPGGSTGPSRCGALGEHDHRRPSSEAMWNWLASRRPPRKFDAYVSCRIEVPNLSCRWDFWEYMSCVKYLG